jgi:hypothetical protein
MAATTITLQDGSGYGATRWTVGEIVHNDARRIATGEPEWLYVLTETQQYFREDGLSFGVGDDRGYVYRATCRAATAEESAQARSEEARFTDELNRQAQLRRYGDGMMVHGERPDGQHRPEGRTIPIGEGQNGYGGGSWFVVGPEYVWYVKNNGADGDMWAANNVETGGAGGIGWRLARAANPAHARLALHLLELGGPEPEPELAETLAPVYEPGLMAWATAEQTEAIRDIRRTGTYGREAEYAAIPIGQLGRYHLPGQGWAANARDALFYAFVYEIPLEKIELTRDVELIYRNGERRFTGHPFALWADGTATTGECFSAPSGELAIPKVVAQLVSAAIRQAEWQDGRWKRLLAVDEVREVRTVATEEHNGASSGEQAIVTELQLVSQVAELTIYRVAYAGWAMGEDGDAWDDKYVYLDEAAARAKARGLVHA